MRWQKKQKSVTAYKIVKRFALLPICINNEWRWFETCYILKTRQFISWIELEWVNTSWVSKNAYLVWKQGARRCDEHKCKHCIDGVICALQYNANIDNYGICRSREVK